MSCSESIRRIPQNRANDVAVYSKVALVGTTMRDE